MIPHEKWQTMEEYPKVTAWVQILKSFLNIFPRNNTLLTIILHNTILSLQYRHSYQQGSDLQALIRQPIVIDGIVQFEEVEMGVSFHLLIIHII